MPYKVTRLNLNALPFSFTSKDCKIPDFPVTYIIFDDVTVFYVGATKSLFSRWGALKNSGRLRGIIKRKSTKVAWIAVATIQQLSDFEPALIQFLNPKLNYMRNGNTYHHANAQPRKKRPKYTKLES